VIVPAPPLPPPGAATDAIHVGVAAAIHDDLVPRLVGEVEQIRMGHELPVDLSVQETTLATRDDQEFVQSLAPQDA
jgi:hypothetical protein